MNQKVHGFGAQREKLIREKCIACSTHRVNEIYLSQACKIDLGDDTQRARHTRHPKITPTKTRFLREVCLTCSVGNPEKKPWTEWSDICSVGRERDVLCSVGRSLRREAGVLAFFVAFTFAVGFLEGSTSPPEGSAWPRCTRSSRRSLRSRKRGANPTARPARPPACPAAPF